MDEVGIFWLEYRILAVLLNNKTADYWQTAVLLI